MLVRLYIALAAIGFMLSTGCSKIQSKDLSAAPPVSRTTTESLIHNGVERTYHVRLPSRIKRGKPNALVIVLHGGGGRGDNFDELMTNGSLTAAADSRSVVLVFPEGVKKQWNDGRTEILKGNRQYDDVGFISAVIDKVVEHRGIDATRVYATGISNGGHMSMRLAMDLSTKIAAVAPVTAQISKAIADKTPEAPISVMIVNGTKDPLVPFHGGHIRLFRFGRSRGEVLSTEQSVRFFRRHNACASTPIVERLADRDPNDGTRVEIQTYGDCRDGTEVILVKVIGGGHTWPGGKQYLRSRRVGPVSRDVNASELILNFFLSHSRTTR